MRRAHFSWVGALVAATTLIRPLAGQERGPEQIEASYQAHQGEFDYLLGDWTFTAQSREWGAFDGRWSAVRLAEGQILDEWRIVGDSGETTYVTTTLRAYNAVAERWELVGMDAGNGLQDVGTGRKVGTEMHIEQKFGVVSANPTVMRIRYYDIQPDRFSWAADRSADGGATWERDSLRIEARRIGPARRMGALTGPARR
ncbi:MAG TPA: hypothetical protein VGA02_04955 [Gemmatimonadales bacterium]|jgi:hypothetical protein